MDNLLFVKISDPVWRKTQREGKHCILSQRSSHYNAYFGEMDGESCFYSCCNNFHHPVNSDGGFILLVPLSQFSCCISDENVRQTKVALYVATQLNTTFNCWCPKMQLAVNMLYSDNKPSVIRADFIFAVGVKCR
jgi:hypothetical protein